MKYGSIIAAAALAIALAMPRSAIQAQVVTPSSAPSQGWFIPDPPPLGVNNFGTTCLAEGNTTAITSAKPDPNNTGDQGSLQFNLTGDNACGTYATQYFSSPILFSNLTTSSYDYFVQGLEGVLAPTAHLLLETCVGTVCSFDGQLVYEPYRNGGAFDNSWVSADLFTGNDIWLTRPCAGVSTPGNQQSVGLSINTWQGESCLAGAEVFGISYGAGSGWGTSPFTGFADDAQIAFGTAFAEDNNFEPNPGSVVPEPASMSLMAAGLSLLFATTRKRRRQGQGRGAAA